MADLEPTYPTKEEIILEEITEVQRIIADETWYEGERRGQPVRANDPVVQKHVHEIINEFGMDLHQRAMYRILNKRNFSCN